MYRNASYRHAGEPERDDARSDAQESLDESCLPRCWMHTGSWVAPSDFSKNQQESARISKNQHDLGEKRGPLGGGFSRSVISFGLANSCLNCCNRVLAVAPGVSQDTQVCGSSDSRCAGRTR